jgi:hypothetical protein
MATEKPTKRKGGGSKLARSEQVSIRLDPKLRLAAELAAAKERRTLSSFIEWAVERAVKEIPVAYRGSQEWSAAEVADSVWDVDAPERFVNLASQFPELLTHEEQRQWKFISETYEFWQPASSGREFFSGPKAPDSKLNFPAIRMAWGLIESYLAGEGPVLDGRTVFDWNEFANLEDRETGRVKVYHPSNLEPEDIPF